MKKAFNLSSFTKFSGIAAGVIVAAALVLFFIFAPADSAHNPMLSMLPFALKALAFAVFAYGVKLLYFAICFKKAAVRMSLFSVAGSAVSAVVAFAFCIICRAPMGNMTFAVVLFSILFSVISSVLFFRNLPVKKKSKKQKNTDASDVPEAELTPFEIASSEAFSVMLVILMITALILLAAFAVALIFSAYSLCIYVLPAILSSVFSVVFTLSLPCYLYSKKV